VKQLERRPEPLRRKTNLAGRSMLMWLFETELTDRDRRSVTKRTSCRYNSLTTQKRAHDSLRPKRASSCYNIGQRSDSAEANIGPSTQKKGVTDSE